MQVVPCGSVRHAKLYVLHRAYLFSQLPTCTLLFHGAGCFPLPSSSRTFATDSFFSSWHLDREEVLKLLRPLEGLSHSIQL